MAVHLSWTSPKPLGRPQEYALAWALRTLKAPDSDSYRTPPSVLTSDDALDLCKLYAYLLDRIDRNGLKTDEQLVNDLAVGGQDEQLDELSSYKRWANANLEKVAKAMGILCTVVDSKDHAGFTVWG